MSKLDAGQKHILKLIDRDKDAYGLTAISNILYNCLSRSMPKKLVIFEKIGSYGKAHLTEEGNAVLRAMKYL